MKMEAVIPWLARIAPTLSIIGSASIVYMILSDRQRKLQNPKHRLMLMMSSFDILSSTALFISKWAVGNSVSCTAQGICLWLGTAVPSYNSSLNLYYLLTIKYSMSQPRFSTQIEPLLHVISIAVPLAAAITFAVIGDIMPRGLLICFTGSTRGSILVISGISFHFLFCIFSMLSICWSVKRRASRMEIYRFRRTTTNPPKNRRSMSTRRERLEEMETVKQAILYTSAFFITYIGLLIRVIYNLGDHGYGFFYLTIFISISYPLQGFWNFAIYVRPGVNRIRERDQDKSLIRAIIEVVFKARSDSNIQDDVPDEVVPTSPRAFDDAQVSIDSKEENDNIHIITDSAPATKRRSLVNLASILSEIDLGDSLQDDV